MSQQKRVLDLVIPLGEPSLVSLYFSGPHEKVLQYQYHGEAFVVSKRSEQQRR
jgi:hypothetical protein